MNLKELVEKLNKIYDEVGDVEVQTMNGEEDYKINNVYLSNSKDELFLDLKSIEED